LQFFQEARAALDAAHKREPDDLAIQLAAPRVLMFEPGKGPEKALMLLDNMLAANQKKGREETLPFRLLRLDLLFAQRSEQVVSQLLAATEGIDKWQPQAQAAVWAEVGAKLERLGQLPDAAMCMEKAAKLAPGLLQHRVALFELALKQGDDDAMRAAQKQILELVKSEADPDYAITEAKRLMFAFAANQITKDELQKARTILDAAIKQRPTWANLHVTSGQLALLLEKDTARALKDLDVALENGASNLQALNLQVRLLAELGRFPEARERMKLIPAANWTALLDRNAANVLRAVGEHDLAVDEARKLVDANPQDTSAKVWFAEIATAAKQEEEAEKALQDAVALRPSDPDLWTALLNFYMFNNRAEDVESTLRQAQLELDEEYLTLLTAQQHRLFGRFPQAETILLSAYRDRMDELAVAQRMAEFYLAWGDHMDRLRQTLAEQGAPREQWPAPGSLQQDRAKPYLNRILRAANEGRAPHTDPNVSWARRKAAGLLSLSGDYQDSLKAERLLAGAVESNVATTEGQDLLVEVLNRRGDPASRERIIALLKQIQQQRVLTPQQELLLGKALNDVGQWDECQDHMEAAVTRHPDDPALRVAFVEMLIERREFSAADRWLSRLTNLPSAAIAIPQLRIHLAAARGDKAEARKQLEALTPDLRVLNAKQLQVIRALASLADDVGDHEYALKLMQVVAGREPGNELALAQFVALYGDLDAGLSMLAEQFQNDMDAVLGIAVNVLRARRAEDPAKIDEAVNRMVGQARRDDPDAARRMVMEAETLEVQEKFDEAIAAYKRILARDDVPKDVRAATLNNLAFLLAMTKQELDFALKSVDEAIEIIGPISDILDTRALVHFHRGDYAAAVKDLQLAVKMQTTASKYFHLAEALLGAGDEAAALAAWEEAEARGISADAVPAVEREDFEAAQRKIGALRTQPGNS
jgi:tetratricopeptide (TPR) repeat protein